ncbi:amidohydrolase [Ottowia sp. VDI28]|uniref:amidohydrolase n=1 Tax=unclassified Ottowia TaxID=2645081 RepID=UPI003C2E61A6
MMLKPTALAAIAAALLSSSAAAAPDAVGTAAAIRAAVERDYPVLDALYKDIHAHPELSFQETRTAAKLAEAMRGIGFEVMEKVGGTGVVAIFRNGHGPVAMVRTELDALPMEEKTGLDYASRTKAVWNGRETFVAHSCGHDIHMAAWVGTARRLVDMKDRWHGTLMFVAQPAEETVSGAKAMLKDGLFTRYPKPDVAFALHVAPFSNDAISFAPGIRTSNSDQLEIDFHGRGGHGSMPDKTIDPVVIAARFVTDLQSVLARQKNPAEFGVLTIGSIQGGSAPNIVPDNVLVRGSLYTRDLGERAKLLASVERVAKASAAMSDAPVPDIRIVEGVKGVVNDVGVTARAAKMLRAALGDKVRISPPTTAGEDFSEFVDAGVPSMFFGLGAYAPEREAAARNGSTPPLPPNHSPAFAPEPRPTISLGVLAMSLAVLSSLDPAP